MEEPRFAAGWGMIEGLVSRVPSYRNTQTGRQKASFAKFMFVVIAVGIALGSPPLWPLSLAVALFSYPLPIRHSKKSTWLEKAREAQVPQAIQCLDDGLLEYDGAKLSARRNERVVESLRPEAEKCRISVQDEDGGSVLVISPHENSKKPVWVFTGCSPLPDYVERTPPPPERRKIFALDMEPAELLAVALQFAVLAPLEPGEEWPYRQGG